MTHAHVALDVEGGASGEAERLHVGEHLSLVKAGVGPRAPEATD